jgi:hypothetical protein
MKNTIKNTIKNKIKQQNGRQNKTKKLRVFKKKDFLSGDGFMVSVWGPIFWTALHTMSFNYPITPTKEDKIHYMDFILNLQYILPCKYCRINLTNNFKEKPLTMAQMESRDTFSRYVYELHEIVNKMLKKKSSLSYNDVRERYEHFRSRCTEEKPRIFTFKKTTSKNREKEQGCTEPLYGKKAKCVINIVPQEDKTQTFKMDKKCIKKRT